MALKDEQSENPTKKLSNVASETLETEQKNRRCRTGKHLGALKDELVRESHQKTL